MFTNASDDAVVFPADFDAPQVCQPKSAFETGGLPKFGGALAGFASAAVPRASGAITSPLVRVEIAPAAGVQRRGMTWTGAAAEYVEATARDRIEFRLRARVHLLVAYEQAARRAGETYVEGAAPSQLRDLTRRLTFVPAGHEYHEWHDPRTLTRILFFYFDPALLPLRGDPCGPDVVMAPRLHFEDSTLWDTVMKVRKLLDSTTPDDAHYGEALAAVLMHEVVRLNRRDHAAKGHVRGGLAAWQQRLVATYIEEHLAESIPLAKLAELVRLSPYHFCRAFKQSFGVPPHRYHTQRRIERAKEMLAKPDFSVTDIGLTVGFSETSSFTAAFRKATGVTPTGYHRSLA